MNRRLLLIAVCIPLLAGWAGFGCSGRAERLDQRDENHPLMRRAQARKRAGDTDRAVVLYQEALERRPSLARAHLELGHLFDQEREDYVRAIYHYERYLEMRPHAQKQEMVSGLIRTARLAYAASLPDQPSGAVQRIAELQRENQRLRREIGALLERADPPPPTPVTPRATAPRAGPSTEPAVAPPAATYYTVESGDTLSRIASKVYGDAHQWTRIFEANRQLLDSPGSVRPGQRLVIPSHEGSSPP